MGRVSCKAVLGLTQRFCGSYTIPGWCIRVWLMSQKVLHISYLCLGFSWIILSTWILYITQPPTSTDRNQQFHLTLLCGKSWTPTDKTRVRVQIKAVLWNDRKTPTEVGNRHTGIEHRALCLLGKYSANWAKSPVPDSCCDIVQVSFELSINPVENVLCMF